MLVRLLEDGTWWVRGAVSGDLLLDSPRVGDVVTSPVELRGRASAFEGRVGIRVVEDGGAAPLASGFATGGGDVLRPFTASLPPERRPAASRGAVVLSTASAEDGRVWQVSVVRIRFGS